MGGLFFWIDFTMSASDLHEIEILATVENLVNLESNCTESRVVISSNRKGAPPSAAAAC